MFRPPQVNLRRIDSLSGNRGDLVSHTVHVTNQLRKAGIITEAEQQRIVTAATAVEL